MRFLMGLVCGLMACQADEVRTADGDATVTDAASDVLLTDARLPDATLLDAQPMDAAPAEAPPCETSALIFSFGEAETVIDDVTGDGQPDRVHIEQPGADRTALFRIGDGARLRLPESFLAVGRVDLNGDGRGDLALSMPWEDHFVVFLGPVAGELTLDDATLHIKGRGQNGDISQRMGYAFAVGDFDDDRIADVLLTAPAEEEEACAGTEAPRFFAGPFPMGARLGSGDATSTLGGDLLGSCLGEGIECRVDHLLLSSPRGDQCFGLPFVGDDLPVDCP